MSVLTSNPKLQEDAQRALFDFTKGCRVSGDQNYTHNALVAPKGKYFITNQKLSEFFTHLCNLVAVEGHSGLMEKNEPRMPILVDNDFDFHTEDAALLEQAPILYDDWVVTEQIKAYQESIKQYCDVRNPKSLVCCVFEKKQGYVKRGLVHNGFHLQFPFAMTDADEQQSTLRPRVINLLKTRGVMQRMTHKDAKEKGWDDIVDEGLPKKTWVMYGCRKDANMEPYRLTAIYDQDGQLVYKRDDPSTHERLRELFNPAELTFVKQNMLPLSFFDKHPPEYYLPIFLSIRAWDTVVTLKDEIKAIIPTEAQRKKRVARVKAANNTPGGDASSGETVVRLKDITALTEMLSKDRAEKYDTWMHVGWCLSNVTNGSAEGLELWIAFSQKSSKFKDGECEEKWEQMDVGNWSIGSLRFWAQHDNPEAYKAWRSTQVEDLMRKALSGSNFDVAKLIHKLYEGRFCCASMKMKLWYEFKDHRWRVTDNGVALYHTISHDVLSHFEKYRIQLSADCVNADEEGKAVLNERINKLQKLIPKLGDTTFKNKVMTELMALFYDAEFFEQLDTNIDLLVFRNGVLDIGLRTLRPGVPEDRCSKSTGIDFPTHYTWQTPEVREIVDYLSKVFPSEGVRTYFKRFAASCLRGGNRDRILPEFTGCGANSKSGITEFFARGFGTYSVKLPNTMFTGKSGAAGACTPDLERCRGARIGFIQEPEAKETLNMSKVKEVTGDPTIYSRDLYKPGANIQMDLKFAFICNVPMKIPSNEPAIWGRIKLLPFVAWFTNKEADLPPTEEEQRAKSIFRADPYFPDKIPRLAAAFMWVLWQEYPVYVQKGLEEPREVTEATDAYKADTDVYSHFIKDKIEVRDGNKLGVTKMFKFFAAWFKVNFPSIQVPSRVEMRDSLNRLWRRPLSTETWLNLDIKPDEEVDMSGVLGQASESTILRAT